MTTSSKGYVGWGAVALAGIALVGWAVWTGKQPGKYDDFARCLGEKGAIFYGAFWCPHCQNQKAMFGKSKKYLPYVECSTPNGQGVTQVCKDKGIEGYPTWVFADDSRESGEVALSRLAEKTSCALPE